jgi:hypothetical protein
MATLTLRPNAAGASTELTKNEAGGYNWDRVDEVVADDATTFVTHSTNSTWQTDLYNVPNHTTESGTINSVKVYTRQYVEAAADSTLFVRVKIYTHSTAYHALQTMFKGSWTTSSYTWTTNPNTGLAWTWDEIDDMQIGASLYSGNALYFSKCTQVYAEVDYTPLPVAYTRSITTSIGLQASMDREVGISEYLCIASRGSNSIKTKDGSTWTSCAIETNALPASYFAQFENRLCALNYQYMGLCYSDVNDIGSNWTNEPYFPNLPSVFNGMFAGRDSSGNNALYFLTPKGMYLLDVFENMVFSPTEANWEIDDNSGKKGLYFRGKNYVLVNKGILEIAEGVATPIGPDMDDGLPEELQGVITDIIGVGFWLVIAIDGGASKKSSILKRYITGTHWQPVYVGSLNAPIRTLCWDSNTLYFGEGTNVKSLPLYNAMSNAKQQSGMTYCATGSLTYPRFSSDFEAMTKVAHKVRAVTRDCNDNEKVTMYYRIDDDTDWTLLGEFATSPRPTALSFGDNGIEFESIQLKAVYERGSTTTNSPKVESLTLEYRPIPPTLWGWTFKAMALTSGAVKGQSIIDALTTAMSTKTLMSFYPTGNSNDTEYFVEVSGMPASKKGTEFGQEGIFQVSVQEVVD